MKSTMKTTTRPRRGMRLLLLLLVLLLTLSACAKDGGEPAGSEGTNATPTEQPTEKALPYRIVQVDDVTQYIFEDVSNFQQYYDENLKEQIPFYFWLDAEQLDAQLTVTLSRHGAGDSWTFLHVHYTFIKDGVSYRGSIVQRVRELVDLQNLTQPEWEQTQVAFMGSDSTGRRYAILDADGTYGIFTGWISFSGFSIPPFDEEKIASEVHRAMLLVHS